MSGYLSGTLAILCINLIFAYAIFVTAAAGHIAYDSVSLSPVAFSASRSLKIVRFSVWSGCAG